MEAEKVAGSSVKEQPQSNVVSGAAASINAAAKPQQAKFEDNAVDPDEDFPDPDEDFPDDDDLDDLDAELDQFITPAPKLPAAPPMPPAQSAQGKGTEGEGTMSDEDFQREFSNEMRILMKELDESSPEMKAQLDELFSTIEQEDHTKASENLRPGTSSSAAGPKLSFKDTIAGLTEQLENSDKAATENIASGAGTSGEDALLAQLLKNLSMGALSGEGGGSEEDFTNMLLGMMEQLTAKEILYDPMKELQQGFPGWIDKNKDKVPDEEMRKHREQLKLVNEIVSKYEEPGYSDDDADRRKYIIDRMQIIQSTGAIPQDLLGAAPSMQEAFNDGGACNPQ